MWQGTKFEENMITCILARLWHLSVLATDYCLFFTRSFTRSSIPFLVQDFHKNPDELVLCRNARTCSHWICQITTLMRRRLWRYIHTYHPDISRRLPTPKINV
jgi:hypothetical protein